MQPRAAPADGLLQVAVQLIDRLSRYRPARAAPPETTPETSAVYSADTFQTGSATRAAAGPARHRAPPATAARRGFVIEGVAFCMAIHPFCVADRCSSRR